MPKYGPRPKQFSQAGATPGDVVTATSGPVDKVSPEYVAPDEVEFYLGQGTFGNASDDALVKGDTTFPDLDNEFETFDFLTAFGDSQRLDVSYQGRLSEGQAIVAEIRVNILGEDAALTFPPQYRLKVYVEGAATANPVYDTGLIDAPDIMNEVIINGTLFSDQPLNQKRYHVVVEAHMDSDQVVYVSRPFVRQA
jgi:hypothetical protein